MRRITALFALMAIAFCANAGNKPGLVKVDGGYIQGTVSKDMAIYKGIPFAAPPVGDLRWKAPQPLAPWDGIRSATTFAAGPMQGGQSNEGFSEDCLYLNVWSPAKSEKDKLPVLVWIYGGGFAMGNTADPSYDCEALARQGEIVLVSINYRVGKLGFFAHPELSAENSDHVSGNYGLLDQIAGLKWIQKNIATFGGDPNKVTIFGESAGGISVSMLCASPLAKGLFHGAISESGGSFGPTRATTYPGENMKTLAQAETDGVSIAEGLKAASLAELRALDASAFVEPGLSRGGGWPIVDGYVIPGDQFELYQKGEYNDVPVLIGYNSDEGASFSGRLTAEEHIASVKQRYGQFADTLLKVYPMENNKVTKPARDLMRDAAFGWQTWSWARLQAKTGKSKVFLYYFDQHPTAEFGSFHGQEVAYVFQHLGDKPMMPGLDEPLSKAMGYYWTNFAKYGNPNGPQKGLVKWPEYSGENGKVMYLTNPAPRVGSVPSYDAIKVLDGYFEWRRTAEGKAWAK